MKFDRAIYFDAVRGPLFGGSMTQEQVDGQEAILTVWEVRQPSEDLRFLSYPLATTYHECSTRMWPIEEYGKGAGHDYGNIDPETGVAYYGRGFVQLTHRSNYDLATQELHLSGEYDLVWHPERALGLIIASAVMFKGMIQGWFRSGQDGKPQTLERYFSASKNDAYGAREIINGDKTVVPDWSGGVSIGNLIKGYHDKFLAALTASAIDDKPTPPAELEEVVITIEATDGVKVTVRQV